MKKLFSNASPFLMLLVPVFFCIALLIFGAPAEIPSGKVAVSPIFHVPSFQALIKTAF